MHSLQSPSWLCRRNPSKLAVEAAWAVYFILWSSVVTVVMVGGYASVWGDNELLAFGVLMAVATLVVPLLGRRFVIEWVLPRVFRVTFSPAETAWAMRHYGADLFVMWAGVCALSFGLNLGMTWFFFDVLHMRYGFRVSDWAKIERNPIFLYFLTVAYFSSYSVLGAMLYRRALLSTWQHSPRTPAKTSREPIVHNKNRGTSTTIVFRWLQLFAARVGSSLLLAFLETLLMANPLIEDVFCYDDVFLTLTFGSVCYAVSFVFALSCWMRCVPESVSLTSDDAANLEKKTTKTRDGKDEGFSSLTYRVLETVVFNIAASVLTAVVLHYIRWHVAPLFTTVVDNSPPVGGCLLLKR